MKSQWSESECRELVRDYLKMLKHEEDGVPFKKVDHWRGLLPVLNGRTKGAIEKKYQNVSAVLEGLGLTYVSGYKPLRNYQLLLKQVVHTELKKKKLLAP